MTESYTGIDCLEILRDARNYNAFLISEILRHQPSSLQSNESIMDFGAGLGTFAEILQKQGVPVVCVEPDRELRSRLEKRGFPTFASLEDVPPGSQSYIYSLNVLEHIKDDQTAVRELANALRPGGQLFLYVPAFNFLYSSFDKKVGHFRRYRRSTLLPLLKNAGLEVETSYYSDSLGYIAALFYKLCCRREQKLNMRFIKIYDRIFFPLARLGDFLLKGIVGKNLAVKAIKRA